MRNAPLLDALLSRRSVRPRRLTVPGPSPDELRAIVRAGLRGSDHGGLRPWRLILLNDRDRLAAAFLAAERELRPDGGDEMAARAVERARNGPCLLALAARIDEGHPNVPAHEQWAAVGAALNQMLLAAGALGYAGGILSGAKTRTAALRGALQLAAGEHIAGFLTFGTASADPPDAPVADPDDFLSEWPPSPSKP